jgi:UDP-2,3-diacylglucosamine pyrophosphatase LpxH
MSTIKLVVSDLHLSDSASLLDCFGDTQQSAFEGLLCTASRVHHHSSLFSQAENIELIINGDTFDFLATKPYDTYGVTNPEVALEKLNKIINAHAPFFAALRSFLEVPNCSVTFMMGNHDIELCFAEVCERICFAIVGARSDPRMYFCPTRFYQPLPDVYIEHGNHYDFWNHATSGLWDEQGQPLMRKPSTIVLPVGSHYFQHAAYPVSLRYAYFDHFEPSMNIMRQLALLSLLNPDIIIETAHKTMELLSYPRKALAHLSSKEERNPVRLFEETMQDFVAFQEDMVARKSDWTSSGDDMQISPEVLLEFSMMREALTLPLTEAVATICTPTTYQMGESVARGMYAVLKNNPALRYAIAGHTHMERFDVIHNATQAYLNTASWTQRFAPPTPDEIRGPQGPALLEWLRHPDWKSIPLRNVTRLAFALLISTDAGPTNASLCAWEGGLHGCYRVLARSMEY